MRKIRNTNSTFLKSHFINVKFYKLKRLKAFSRGSTDKETQDKASTGDI